MLWGAVGAPSMLDTSLTCWTPPSIWWMPPHMSYPPLIGWIPCTSVCFREYLYVIWGILPLCWGLGNYPICWGFGGHQHLCQALVSGSTSTGCPLCFIFTFLVAHYVSHIYHRYDYYSSGNGCVFWSVIYFISDHGHFLGGASCNIGSA